MRAFEQAYAAADVHVEIESFEHIDEAIARLQDPASDFDVVFPVIDVLPGLVDAGLLRPLNHDYLPHVRNLWGWFRGDGPFYDPGQRYTTPYTVYTGGIGWRADVVADARRAGSPRRPVRRVPRRGVPEPGGDLRRVPRRARARSAARGRDGSPRRERRRARRGRGLPGGGGGRHRRALHRRRRLRGPARGDVRGAPGVVRRHPDGAAVRRGGGRRSARGRRRAALLVAGRSRAGRRARPHRDLLAGPQPRRRARVPRSPAALRRGARQLRVERLPGADDRRHRARRSPIRRSRGTGPCPRTCASAIVSEDAFAAGQMLVGFGPSQDARWLAQWSRVVPA